MVDVVVSDLAAQQIATAITTASAAQVAATTTQNVMLEKLFGATATTASPGGITAASTAAAKSVGDLLAKMDAQTKAINELTVAMGKVASSVETITTAAANMHYTQTQMLTTQQLAVSDQIKNNKFNQLTTNAALTRAELPPTEVKPEEMKTTITNGVKDIGVIKLETLASNTISETLSDTAAKGIKISQEWVAQTAFGKWITSYYAEAKVQAQILFADGEAKAKLETDLKTMRDARLMPTAGK